MHMADALVSPAAAAVMFAASAAAAATAVVQLKKEEKKQPEILTKKLPVMAVMAALVFAGQMINYTIPGTGSSGHICGGMMLTGLLGPWAAFLSMIVVLTIQCLFFADGGLLALGANIWNMAFYGCFVGYFLVWRPLMKSRLAASSGEHAASRLKIILASVLGCVLTLQLGAFSVVLETTFSGITDLPFGAFVLLMQPIHLAIGLVEGLVTAAVLVFVFESRPEMVMDAQTSEGRKGALSVKKTLAVLGVLTLLIGGAFSLLASSNPDGLEWSLFGNAEAGYSSNMGLDEEDYGIQSGAADGAQTIQNATAFLPDYAFAGDEDNALGTTVSGIVGAAMTALLAGLVMFIVNIVKRKKVQQA